MKKRLLTALDLAGWGLHWFGQGTKLGLFTLLAGFFPALVKPAAQLLLDSVEPFAEQSLGIKAATISACVFLILLGIAVFTALLASMLAEHPLRPYKWKWRQQSSSTSESFPGTAADRPA